VVVSEICFHVRSRAEAAESNLTQQLGELDELRMRNGILTAELAATESQLRLLKQSEAELLADRSWKQEELASLRAQLEAADLRAASSDEEQERAAAELASLRSLLADMSAEREQLQARLAESQEEAAAAERRQQQQHQQQPPPDVTAGSQQQQQQQRPDVARSTQHGNPPDLMPGNATDIAIQERVPFELLDSAALL
jgi:chromosome segregation ATPase